MARAAVAGTIRGAASGLLVALAVGQPLGAQHPTEARVEPYAVRGTYTVRFRSAVYEEEREVFVGLPDAVDSTTAHPVIVVLEGEVLFETASVLARLMASVGEIPPSIVVGVPLRGRYEEYAPPPPGEHGSGAADRQLRHLGEELFPLLDARWGVGTDRLLWAHSGLGGAFCTYALLGPDTLFTGILSSSPSLRWAEAYVEDERAFDALAEKGRVFYYLTFGDSEEEAYMGDMFDRVQRFRDRLADEAPSNLAWEYRLYEGNNHFTNAVETYIDGLKLYFARR
jgi:predicted alpha/beta superfamily hydrolase